MMKKQMLKRMVLACMVLSVFIIGCTEIEYLDPGLKPIPTPALIKGAHTNGDFTWEPANPGPGDTVTLTPTAETEYKFFEFNASPARTFTPIADGKFTFPMPAMGSVTINAVFLHNTRFPYEIIKGGVVGNGDFSISPSGSAIPGTPITLTPIETDILWEFDEWDLNGIDDSELLFNTDGSAYFFMPDNPVTIGAEFVENLVKLITSFEIALTAPVYNAARIADGTAAPVTNVLTDGGGTTTVTSSLTQIRGANFRSNNYIRKSAYEFTYRLTADGATGRFGNFEDLDEDGIVITLTNAASISNADEIEFTYTRVSNAEATLIVTMPRTVHWPAVPTARDLAFESVRINTERAAASSVSSNNPTARSYSPFVGTSWLLNTGPAVWQAQGSVNAHWVGVDLGEVKQVSTVIITWAGGAENVFDAMTVGEIQVATEEFNDPEALVPFFSTGNYSDDGWTGLGGEFTPGAGSAAGSWSNGGGWAHSLFVGGTRPLGGTTEHPWWIILDVRQGGQPVEARWIRAKVTAPLTGGNADVPGVHTTWPRVSCFEVYEEVLTGPLPEVQ